MGRDLWPIRSPDGTSDERESGKSREESADRQKRMQLGLMEKQKRSCVLYVFFFLSALFLRDSSSSSSSSDVPETFNRDSPGNHDHPRWACASCFVIFSVGACKQVKENNTLIMESRDYFAPPSRCVLV